MKNMRNKKLSSLFGKYSLCMLLQTLMDCFAKGN
jgi:hypothetical protein